jgi:hypothetical protein
MSRHIDLTKPLSDADRAYLESRGRYRLIDLLDKGQRGGSPAPSAPTEVVADKETEAEPSVEDWVADLTVRELRLELEKLGQPEHGNKAELQARLSEALAAQS